MFIIGHFVYSSYSTRRRPRVFIASANRVVEWTVDSDHVFESVRIANDASLLDLRGRSGLELGQLSECMLGSSEPVVNRIYDVQRRSTVAPHPRSLKPCLVGGATR